MKRAVFFVFCVFFGINAMAQDVIDNPIAYYSEGKDIVTVQKDYVLPDALVTNDGKQVKNVRQWEKVRRPEIMSIFNNEMFGEVPGRPEGLHFALACPDSIVYDGIAIRRRVNVFLDSEEKHSFEVLIHFPVQHNGRIPMFVGLNFKRNAVAFDVTRHQWPYEFLVKEGFGVAVAYHSSIEPDTRDFIKDIESANVRSWYKNADEWGAISAWAWGLSRIVDYLETCPEVDCSRLAVIGHSRLGKTALWASANDTRFSLCISNCSGCCGAAISRRTFGETFKAIATTFPYWFVPRFQTYKERENDFPADQHELIALTAPRAIYVASAAEDHWADPRGEWLAAKEAGAVYELYGLKGLSRDSMQPLGHTDDYGSVAYKVRSGEHALWPDDWYDYVKYAKRQFYPEQYR